MKERQINIFNLSFLDMLCCALGAMILIFILETRILTTKTRTAVAEYQKKAEELAEAEENVRYAVDRYRAKAREAGEAQKMADESREIAVKARDEAKRSREAAIEDRNRADRLREEAEARQRALDEMRLKAIESQKQSEKEANVVRGRIAELELGLQQEREKCAALAESNKSRQKQIEGLESDNESLRKTVKQFRSQDQSLKELINSYDNLRRDYEELNKKYERLVQSANAAESENKKLRQGSKSRQEEEQKIQEEMSRLRREYEDMVRARDELSSRLQRAQTELRRRESEIPDRESEIEKLEAEIRAQRDTITGLQKDLQKEDDKSLFGIKLKYRRIVFLFDRSGSITSNNWKQVIVDTCREILINCEVDEFAIIAFSTDMLLYPPKKGTMLAGGRENKDRAIAWLNSEMPFGGSTRMDLAFRSAYEDYGRLDAIFLLTDGLPSAPTHTPEYLQQEIIKYIKLRAQEKGSPKIITIAIGYPPARAEQYRDIYNYLHQICELSGGQYLGR